MEPMKKMLQVLSCSSLLLLATSINLEVSAGGMEQASQRFSQALMHKHRMTRATYPADFNGFVVIAADALVDTQQVRPIDGEHFHREIMGRDDVEYEAVRQQALEFFATRFGMVAADQDPNLMFMSYQVEPFSHYRAYVIAGERVPASGWEVRDGGWMAQVINPEGRMLGGEFEGQWVPPGTFVVYGDYNIAAGCNYRHNPAETCTDPREIIIHYQARGPVFVGGPELPGALTWSFSCEIESERWGRGLAQGISFPELSEDGSKFQYNVRNVMTFSDQEGF